jgi:hypothetical protein
MEFDLKKWPRLLAKLLGGKEIGDNAVITAWNNATLGMPA